MEYGEDQLQFELPQNWRVSGEIRIRRVDPGKSEADIIKAALQLPIGCERLATMALDGKRIGIVISDWTRFTGSDRFLPILFDELTAAGANLRNVTLFIGRGTHREPNISELQRILSESIYQKFTDWNQIHIHDCENDDQLSFLGTTSFGTPVYVNRLLMQQDVKILTGSIVYHYFAGFGGGRKSILPAMSGAATIRKNHSLNVDPVEDRMHPHVRIGEITRNPVALDMLETAQMAKVDFILNTVMDERKRIIYAVAGDLREAHNQGCTFAASVYGIKIPDQADIVVASTQTAKNWIQSHKSLYNASLAVKDNGVIILLAVCPEGTGSAEFEEWIGLGIKGIFARLRSAPALLGQTAYSSLLRGGKTIIVTRLTGEVCRRMGMIKADSLEQAIKLAGQRLAKMNVAEPTVYLMPYAGYTVPFLE